MISYILLASSAELLIRVDGGTANDQVFIIPIGRSQTVPEIEILPELVGPTRSEVRHERKLLLFAWRKYKYTYQVRNQPQASQRALWRRPRDNVP